MPAVSSRGRGRRNISEINMVPFIDVMLVLLIIFMVTAPLITPSMIAVPKIGKAALQPTTRVEVQISLDETVLITVKNANTVSGSPIASTMSDLGSAVLKVAPATKTPPSGEQAMPVVITADKSLKYETVVKAMDTLQKAGVSRVALAMRTTGK